MFKLGWINILNRNNDLQEFFWPIIFFIKDSILISGQIPLWNNLFLAGTPLLPDPQSQIFYLPNMLFLLFDMDQAFIVSMFLHSFLGGLGIYACSRKIFGFSKFASFFTALIYIFSPKMAGFLESGHIGLIYSHAWIPFVLFATYQLMSKAKFKWFVLLSISLSALFFTHIIIFFLGLIVTGAFYTFLAFQRKTLFSKNTLFFILSLITTAGLISIQLLPMLQWSGETTRFLLLENRDVYPKWTSVREFLQVTFIPWTLGVQGIWAVDPEKWLALGTAATLLSVYGFLNLKLSYKIAISTLTLFVILISLNNASLIYSFLINQDFYALMRVSTRIWFVQVLIVTFLAGFGLSILRKKSYKLSVLIGILAISEILFLSWTYLLKPVSTPDFASSKVIDYLKSDKSRFRVFCINRCISQKEAAKQKLELLEGYSTIQQKNFYKQAWQLTGGYWNYYTLSIPPIGLYKFEKLQPDPKALGAYNVKYVLSPHNLVDNNFRLNKRIENYFIYENRLFLERAYYMDSNRLPASSANIIKYSPNNIVVDTSQKSSNKLVLSEVYSKGWKAYLNGVSEVPVQETPQALRLVDLKVDTKFVDFKYQPESFRLGALITFMTVGLFFITILLKLKR